MQIRAFLVNLFFGLAFFRSLSFISATGASSFLLFAVCYLLTDVLGWWNGAPFLYPGNDENLNEAFINFFFLPEKRMPGNIRTNVGNMLLCLQLQGMVFSKVKFIFMGRLFPL